MFLFDVWRKPFYQITKLDEIVMTLEGLLVLLLFAGLLLGGAWMVDRWYDWRRSRDWRRIRRRFEKHR